MTIAHDNRTTSSHHQVRRQLILFGGLGGVAAVVDQVAKAVAWRHYDGTVINRGGYYFLGDAVRGWFAHPVGGWLADGVGWLLLAVVAWWLLRTRRGRLGLTGAALVIGGFASNLADRVGLHHLTAPGSERGVIDFIPSGSASRCNLADITIVVGVVLLAIRLVRRVVGSRRVGRTDATSA